MNKINLLIRGHIRDSFDDEKLKNLVELFSSKFRTDIFIHTWNVVQNNISWRHMEKIDKPVNEELIRLYLGNLFGLVKRISIEDDSKIVLHGKTEGKIGNTPCPVLAWKNMYYGKLRLIEEVYDMVGGEEVAASMRFDLMSNKFNPGLEKVIEFLDNNYEQILKGNSDEKMRFIYMCPYYGLDNIYMSLVKDMKTFVRYMYFEMDKILESHKGSHAQEHISFFERKSPFLAENSTQNKLKT